MLSPSHGRGTADWFGVSKDSDSTQKWQRKSIRHCSQRYGKLKPQVIRELDLPSQDNVSLTSTETPPPLYVGPCQLGMQKVCPPPAASHRSLMLLPEAGAGATTSLSRGGSLGLMVWEAGQMVSEGHLRYSLGRGFWGRGQGATMVPWGQPLHGRASQDEQQCKGTTGGEKDTSEYSGVGVVPTNVQGPTGVEGAAAVFYIVGSRVGKEPRW